MLRRSLKRSCHSPKVSLFLVLKSFVFASRCSHIGAIARVTELETATTSLENGLQLELNSLRESTASMEVDLKDRETALTETMQQVASAKTTVQEWESTSMIV